MTIEAAFSWRMEDTLGSIAPGKRANFTVLDRDPYEIDPSRLGDTRVLGTVYEGAWHPLPAAHVEQRAKFTIGQATNADVSTSSHAVCHEQCGCEVADFVAKHFTARGWAA